MENEKMNEEMMKEQMDMMAEDPPMDGAWYLKQSSINTNDISQQEQARSPKKNLYLRL